MIGHIVEMDMDYIKTSHPNFVGESKAVEVTLQQVKSFKLATTVSKQKDGVESEKAPQSERGIKSRAILARPVNGIVTEQHNQPGSRAVGEVEKPTAAQVGESHRFLAMDHSFSMIHLREYGALCFDTSIGQGGTIAWKVLQYTFAYNNVHKLRK
ncbi:unnamed protein product [Lactuca virosa]|uniref:Uncharacterized protein n=1 Tax=Lactuca virosa TaxID=75947 RepID=A0AAU9NYI8_9ASTR|nr:unnamed protein product [Lactuca virosa]